MQQGWPCILFHHSFTDSLMFGEENDKSSALPVKKMSIDDGLTNVKHYS